VYIYQKLGCIPVAPGPKKEVNMGRRKSLVKQVVDKLMSMAAFGESKYEDKKHNGGKPVKDKIYSSKTMDNYIDVGARFVNWVRDRYGCRTLEEAEQYAGEYLQERIDAGYSAWTIRMEASALNKLYQRNDNFGVTMPVRRREDITQHRTQSWKDNYDEDAHPEIRNFCRSCGVRREELGDLTPEDVWLENGLAIVHVVQGKGGRERHVTSLNDYPYQVAQQAAAEGKKLIFDSIPALAPIHEYRAQFANTLYAQYARPLDEIPKKDRYCCRRERAGTVYDKAAMQVASTALGHNRLDVMTHYLYPAEKD